VWVCLSACLCVCACVSVCLSVCVCVCEIFRLAQARATLIGNLGFAPGKGHVVEGRGMASQLPPELAKECFFA